MKLLLLCLGLTLVCAHHEQNHGVVTSNFDMSKISGEWYTILLASGMKEKAEEQGSFRMFVEYIEALDNSSLLITCHKKINGECAELPFICDETEEGGVYSVSSRNPDVSPQIKKRFEELCENTGIPKENVVDVTNAETHSVSLWEIRGCWLTVLCSASADPCSQD
ncbi:major allergen Equ c 1-like isoform X4 [Phyllostomus discolor]|uniref:Major allergen Equ c 1-like isoform X4 n=1 Tax=Phyllostomus discolor TaxID=89673 RepID=A0A7E6DFZ8_9CHIR|nr:major allergen Equ c 1-like isoform X4 [Phyllostomus discolor]